MSFESYGIHTRVYYIVKHAGGIDKEIRTEWLREKFGFDDETISLVFRYDIEKLLKDNDITTIKQMISEKQAQDLIKAERTRNRLNNMLNSFYCNASVLGFGNYVTDWNRIVRSCYK